MTEAQKNYIAIQKKQSTLRGEFNTLRTTETRSAEQDTRLTALDSELTASETEFRTAADALLTEQTTTATPAGEDAEARERRELCGRANAGAIIMAVTEKRNCSGAELELQQAHGLAENQIPLDMLRVEQRAAGVTTAPTNVGTNQAEIVQPVFANGVGAFLGIDRPTVAAGDVVYPVLATRPDVGGPHSDSSDVPETDSTFNANLLAPDRIQASSMYRRVDAARFPSMDSALRMALNSGLEEKLDYEVLRGTEGLLTGSKLSNHNKTGETTHAQYLSQFCFGRVDGRYASEQSDLKVLMGKRIVRARGQHLSGDAEPIRPGRADGEGSCSRVGACARRGEHEGRNNVIRLGMRSDYVQPMWMGVTIIIDETSGSGKGEIEVTAVLLMNSKILRAAGFYKQQVAVS